jgi:hypothetical protein
VSAAAALPRTLAICPTCHTADFDELDTRPYPAVRCRGCRLGMELKLSANPLALYDRATYDREREGGGGTPTWARFHHDVAVADLRINQLQEAQALPGAALGVWVDVGCSTGAHLVQARRRGWGVGGVELDPEFCKEASAASGISVLPYAHWIAQAGATPTAVGVVSFFDVLEHLIDPTIAIRAAVASLSAGGVVVVEAPDLDSCETPEEFRTWRHRRITPDHTEHMWYFSKTAVESMFTAYAGVGRKAAFYRPLPGRFTYVWKKG